jgi:hypothetical protein
MFSLKKISCSLWYSLLLRNGGVIYAFGDYSYENTENKEQTKHVNLMNKISFNDIASHFFEKNSSLSQSKELVILGLFNSS